MLTGRGRPLRFVALVGAGWAATRVAMLWPMVASVPAALDGALPIQPADAEEIALPRLVPPRIRAVARPLRSVMRRQIPMSSGGRWSAIAGVAADPPQRDASVTPPTIFGAPPAAIARSPSVSPTPEGSVASRWSFSAWFVTRRGAPAGGALLGGDQLGVRASYALDPARRIQLFGRATAPLAVAGREVAVGIDWRPTRLPVRLVVEQRIGLDGNRGGPAAGVVGGIDGVMLPLDFELSAYGQAGAVWRGRADPFADGAVQAVREVATVGSARLTVGAGLWGAAQREATRIDVGPSIQLTLPIEARAVKLSIDWRQRIAGDARPGSGPALTLGTDF